MKIQDWVIIISALTIGTCLAIIAVIGDGLSRTLAVIASVSVVILSASARES